jgi:hypothetical protein
MARKRGPAAGPELPPGITRFDVVDPGTLAKALDPENPKQHPAEQEASVRAMLRRNGWVKPLVFNERTGKLADGHLRLKIALADKLAVIPVVYGEWDPDQQREILAFLDATAFQSIMDQERFQALRSQLTVGSEPLRALLTTMDTHPFFREGLAGARKLLDQSAPVPDPLITAGAGVGLHVGGNGDEPEDFEPEGDPDPPPPSDDSKSYDAKERAIQIFLDAPALARFNEAIGRLRGYYGTETLTQTVLRAVVEAGEAVPDEAETDAG